MVKKISFCTTCRNRLWQLKETLAFNLQALREDHELVLVDYGSTDEISSWVWDNFRSYIAEGQLTFFEVSNEVSWNSARAKNLAHRLASGAYLFGLDADNFLNSTDLKGVTEACARNVACHQWSGIWGDGSYGRIGVPAGFFRAMGGYDETLLPMGGQDVDLINRIKHLGYEVLQLSPPEISAIQNSMGQKIGEVVSCSASAQKSSKADKLSALLFSFGLQRKFFPKTDKKKKNLYKTMNSLNLKISEFRLENEGPIRVGGGFSYRGILNGRKVGINGFDESFEFD